MCAQQQQQELLRTPVVNRRPQTIDSMISQIDSDARQRREGEKKNAVNSFGKRFDHPPPSLVEEFEHVNKRRRVSLDCSPTSLLAFDEASCGSSPSFDRRTYQTRRSPLADRFGLGIRLRPRNLDKEFSCESYNAPSTREIPFMPF